MPRLDLERVRRLRERFLKGRTGRRAMPDYWRDRADLEAYDEVLGARIGWKWDAALAECAARGWSRSDEEVVLDFGCGGGVAARRYVAAFGAGEVLYHDRSEHAIAFAVEQAGAAPQPFAARALSRARDAAPDVLLVSHVLSELDDRGLAQLEELIQRSGRVVLVESGNRPVARRLQALRDRLRERFGAVAPCPHAAACPALVDDGDWCHFFANPPADVFTDGDWVKAARALGIDLRSLPYAFFAAVKGRPAAQRAGGRVLGRASVNPVVATAQVCRADGLAQLEVTKRADAKLWRTLKKHPEQAEELLADRR
jgi:SAM-dependent methyltransferase